MTTERLDSYTCHDDDDDDDDDDAGGSTLAG